MLAAEHEPAVASLVREGSSVDRAHLILSYESKTVKTDLARSLRNAAGAGRWGATRTSVAREFVFSLKVWGVQAFCLEVLARLAA